MIVAVNRNWEAQMVDLVHDAQDIVGESVVWDDQRNYLAWVDIAGRRIHRLELSTNRHELWPTGEEFPTSLGLRSDGGAIVGLTRRMALWDWDGSFETLAVLEPEEPGHRLNEGRVAPDGSFWVASMQNNLDAAGNPVDIKGRRGRLYRVSSDGAVSLLTDDRFGIPNTMAWGSDGRFVIADTMANQIYAYQLDASGQLSSRKVFAEEFYRGLPDGSCLDAEGCLWTARVAGGACLTRTTQDGRLDRMVELPCSWPTSCCFGGPGLDTLFVTSARFTLSEEPLRTHPHEGGLWALQVGVHGLIESRFSL